MNNFKKEGFRKTGGDFGGKPRFGGGKKFGPGRGHDRGHGREGGRSDVKELFKTTCSACHKSCEVPFRPSGDKPVYCRDCFAEKGPNENRVGKERGSHGGEFRRDARPERSERLSYNRDEVRTPRDSGSEELKRQIGALESKVNRILEILSTHTKHEAATPTVTKEAEVTTSPVPKKVRKPKSEKTKSKAVTKAPKKKVTKK